MSTPPEPSARLTSLEEHAAYTEHTVDQLSGEIAELNKRMHALATRLDSLEMRLSRLAAPGASAVPDGEPGDEPVPPP